MVSYSLEEVIFQEGQYECTWDGNFEEVPSERAIENARWVLQGNNMFPSNVIFQAQFEQGDGTYAIIDGMYFCYEKVEDTPPNEQEES